MCDDSAPATAVAATSDNFREAAKSAGLKLEKKLQDDSDSARKRNGFDSYEIEPYDDILMEVKQKFKDNEFKRLHGGGDFEWRSIRLITSDTSLDRSKYSETPGNPWALPLLVGSHNTAGQPLSIYHGFESHLVALLTTATPFWFT
ncbi:hypothetical protein KC353_g184 [Hortaea werneckii]|nr:hypothetical protein KC353_g184 [Hortaea werneckii]